MTPEQIDAALALCDTATDGPWIACPEDIHGNPGNFAGLRYVTEAAAVADDDPPMFGPIEADNAIFIAAARTGWPEALHALRDALAEVDAVGAALMKCAHARADLTAALDAYDEANGLDLAAYVEFRRTDADLRERLAQAVEAHADEGEIARWRAFGAGLRTAARIVREAEL